jgi:tRNA modification GTPase
MMTQGQAGSDATVALLTPPGGGGIAVVSVRGPAAAAAIEPVFRPRWRRQWADARAGQLCYGHVVRGGERVDEAIGRVASLDPPAFEVNCHGGIVAAAEVIGALCDAGARETVARESAADAARDAGFDAIQAAALDRLPAARTRLVVRVLCDQVNGALSRELAAIDAGTVDADARIARLVASARFGRALLESTTVAIVGPPNAGKSTLFNALVGHGRTIVSPTPGTTRDFVDEEIALGGFPVRLLDTAGLRDGAGEVEAHGVAAARAAARADVLLLVLDSSVPEQPGEAAIRAELAAREPIVLANKSDLPPGRERSAGGISVSAATGRGLDEVGDALLARLPDPAAHPPGSPVVLTREQLAAVRARRAPSAG